MLRQPNGPARPFDVRQEVLLRHDGVLQHDLAGDRGAQRQLALDLRRRETLRAALDDEAADHAVELRPHHRHVGDRRIGDPHLGAVEPEAAGDLLGARHHGARIGAVVGLGQAEAADHLAGRELRQVFLALRLAAVGDRSDASPARTAPTSPSGSRNRPARSRARSGHRRHSRDPRRRIPPGSWRRAGRARPSRARSRGSKRSSR